MNPMVQAALGAILRYLLAGAFAAFAAKGIWTQTESEAYLAGVVGFILMILWALWVKYKDRLKFLTGLAAAQGTTEAEVKTMVAANQAPPAATPVDDAPRLQNTRLPNP